MKVADLRRVVDVDHTDRWLICDASTFHGAVLSEELPSCAKLSVLVLYHIGHTDWVKALYHEASYQELAASGHLAFVVSQSTPARLSVSPRTEPS